MSEIPPTEPQTLVVPGKPLPWKRPLPRASGGRRTDPLVVQAQRGVVLLWRGQRHPRLEGPIRARLEFYMPNRADSTPDVDNLAKLILDALSGEAFDDDRQVVALEVRKHGHAAEPRTEIALWPVPRAEMV